MKAKTVQRLIILALAASLTACASMKSDSPAPATKGLEVGNALTAALASADRPAEDKARDADRKPAELMEFFGVKPGMTTVDIIALGGYVTEVLSVAVGPNGKVYAQNPPIALQLRDGRQSTQECRARRRRSAGQLADSAGQRRRCDHRDELSRCTQP